MNELIPVNYESDQVTISARDLHEFLEVSTDFRKWFPRMTEYGLEEGTDFNPVIFDRVQLEGNREVSRELQDYQLTIDAAKEIAMIQRTEKGKMARQYFIQIEKAWNDPEQVLARALKLADKKIDQLTQKIQDDQPKIEFYDELMDCKNAIEMKFIAKQLNIPGIGRNKLFQILRDEKILMHDNTPYQKYIDSGYFRIHTGTFTHPYGETRQYTKTLVFPRGLNFIRRRIEKIKNGQ